MRSMTGYGNGSAPFPGGRASAEVRTVNHRFLEIKTLLPRMLLPWEGELRQMIAARVNRGRIELTLTFLGRSPRSYTVTLNLDLARAYHQAVVRLQRDLGVNGIPDVQLFASLPDVFHVTEEPQPTSPEVRATKQALQGALTALDRQRSREGKFLQRDLRARIAALEKIRRAIKTRSGPVQATLRQKLTERVMALFRGIESSVEIDQSRLFQEVAVLTQKSDITEELVRLESHLEAVAELLRVHEPVGKRIDFLLQEIHREINTIGAKVDDVPIRHLVVKAKEEVEKLREQVQNIE